MMTETKPLETSGRICIRTQSASTDVCYTFYTTRPGDTLDSIATALSRFQPRQSRAECMQALISTNRVTPLLYPYLSTAGAHRPLPPSVSLMIPDSCLYRHAPDKRAASASAVSRYRFQHALRQANALPAPHRYKFAQVLEQPQLSLLAGVGRFVAAAHRLHEQHALAATIGIASLEQTGDYFKDTYTDFLEHANAVNKNLMRYLAAPLEQRASSRLAFLQSQRELNAKFQRVLTNRVAKNSGGAAARFLSAKELYQDARLNPLHHRLLSADEFSAINRVIRRARLIGRSAIAVEVSLGGLEVYDAYVEQEDWKKSWRK